MHKFAHTLNTFLTGFGQAFSLFPTGALDRYLVRESTYARIYGNFARVGTHLDSAMQKVMDEQERQSPKLGPFTQDVVKDGVLVLIGSKDKSAHAIIEDSDGNTWSFEVTRELAKDLAHHLFGKPVRLMGSGRLHRDEEGQWQYNSLKAVEFQPYSP